ncbi:MAG TPA: SBBP repeat-containing protein, partial [Polyangia bacterium]|nr:SBBP repeat-containing protein [Polyangia bacterium]
MIEPRRVAILTVAGVLGLCGSTSAQSALWTRLSESTPPCRPGAMAVDAAKNIYVAGYTVGRSKGGSLHAEGMCVMKYDASGQPLWTRIYGAPKAAFPYGMAVDPSNGVYVAGSFYGSFLGQKSAGGSDVFLLKLDGDGEKVWMRSSGSRGEETAAAGLAMGKSGSLYVAGYSTRATRGERSQRDFDMFLLKYSPAGDRLWSRTHNAAME